MLALLGRQSWWCMPPHPQRFVCAMHSQDVPSRGNMEALSAKCQCIKSGWPGCNGNHHCLHRKAPSVVTRRPPKPDIPSEVRTRVVCVTLCMCVCDRVPMVQETTVAVVEHLVVNTHTMFAALSQPHAVLAILARARFLHRLYSDVVPRAQLDLVSSLPTNRRDEMRGAVADLAKRIKVAATSGAPHPGNPCLSEVMRFADGVVSSAWWLRDTVVVEVGRWATRWLQLKPELVPSAQRRMEWLQVCGVHVSRDVCRDVVPCM